MDSEPELEWPAEPHFESTNTWAMKQHRQVNKHIFSPDKYCRTVYGTGYEVTGARIEDLAERDGIPPEYHSHGGICVTYASKVLLYRVPADYYVWEVDLKFVISLLADLEKHGHTETFLYRYMRKLHQVRTGKLEQ
jgi:hypothetical protein